MADQVNPLGGLSPGMAQVPQPLTVPSSPKAPPTRSTEFKAKAEDSVSTSKEALEAATKTVEGFLQKSPSDLRFLVDRETGIVYFKIVDPVTQETILQVPAEEILTMSKRLRELSASKDASGVLMDKQG